MPELSLYDPALNPQLLRCILYCEFDPNLGPRPVFQSPDNFVSNEILDCLSDHLIASSELCGHSISVAAFGLRFVGYPQHIRDDKYARNQFMFNVCFVFDDQSDVTAYQPLVQQLNQDLRTLETSSNLLTNPETREGVARILEGVLLDINLRGLLIMPPTSVQDLPALKGVWSKSQPLFLQDVFPRASPAEVLAHEVPVVVAKRAQPSIARAPTASRDTQDGKSSAASHQDGKGTAAAAAPLPLKVQTGLNSSLSPEDDELLPKILGQLDGRRAIAEVAARLSLTVPVVVEKVRSLMYDGVVLTIDAIRLSNIYIPTSLLRDLPADPASRDKCVDYCRASPTWPRPDFNQAYRLLCTMQHGKKLSDVCSEVGLGEQDNINVLRLVTFARVYRYLRRLHHYPFWAHHDSTAAREGVSRAAALSKGRELDHKVLSECTGRQCYDAIAIKLSISVDEVAQVCERGPFKDEVSVIARMSLAGSSLENP